MKTFNQFVKIRKDHELVETILAMGLDPQAVFETAYHVVRSSRTGNGRINEATVEEGFGTMLKGFGRGVASLAASPFVGAAKAVSHGAQHAFAKGSQIWARHMEPARIQSALADLESFKGRLTKLGVLGTDPSVDGQINQNFDAIKGTLEVALQKVTQDGQAGKTPWSPAQTATTPNARNAVQSQLTAQPQAAPPAPAAP